MKYFLKLNVVSILYAFMVFVPLELMLNVYRISRLTNWDIGMVNTLEAVEPSLCFPKKNSLGIRKTLTLRLSFYFSLISCTLPTCPSSRRTFIP